MEDQPVRVLDRNQLLWFADVLLQEALHNCTRHTWVEPRNDEAIDSYLFPGNYGLQSSPHRLSKPLNLVILGKFQILGKALKPHQDRSPIGTLGRKAEVQILPFLFPADFCVKSESDFQLVPYLLVQQNFA